MFNGVFEIEIIQRRSGESYFARNIIYDTESFAFRLVSDTKREVLIEKHLLYVSYMYTVHAETRIIGRNIVHDLLILQLLLLLMLILLILLMLIDEFTKYEILEPLLNTWS